METILQGLRYGLRTLRKSPAFALIAVVTLALGIGANTAMFSIVNGVLLRPLPYANPDRLLRLATSMPQFKDASVSYPNFLDWQQRSRSFEQLALFRNDTWTLTGLSTPERLRGVMTTAAIFPALGIHVSGCYATQFGVECRGEITRTRLMLNTSWKIYRCSDRDHS